MNETVERIMASNDLERFIPNGRRHVSIAQMLQKLSLIHEKNTVEPLAGVQRSRRRYQHLIALLAVDTTQLDPIHPRPPLKMDRCTSVVMIPQKEGKPLKFAQYRSL